MRGWDTGQYRGQELLVVGIVLALSLALAVALFWTVARRYRRFRLGLVETEPKCAGCGYIVHPGSGPICPECGGERLKVGVFTPATAPPIFPWPLAVTVYAFLAIAACWVGPGVARLVPWRWDFRAWRAIETSDSRPAALSREGTFGLMATGTARWWGTWVEEIGFDYVLPERRDALIDPMARTFFTGGHYFGPDEHRLDEDRAAVRGVVTAVGYEQDGEGARLTDEIMSAIRQFRRHEWPEPSASGGYEYVPVYTSGFVEGVLFWIVAAFTAGRFIDRWHWRRRQRALERKEQLLRDLGLLAGGAGV